MSGPPSTGETSESRELRWWRWALRVVAVGLGAVYAAVAALSESMNADGISYLDQGAAWLRGDWSAALNPVWSPFYAWIQGAALALIEPGIQREFATVQLVNFAIYLGTLACFEFFWRQATEAARPAAHAGSTVGIGGRAWLTLGYALFVWSSLILIEIWAVTPDMLVAACLYLAAGLLVRLRGGAGPWAAVGLGAALGVGYLVKAALFPIAFVFLALVVAVVGDLRRGVARTACAAAVFALTAAPLFVALSIQQGGPSFGGVGKLTYLKHVHGVPFPHWLPGVVEGIGQPDSPPRRLLEEPTVWEFAEPVAGTYPLSYNPYHWYKGLSAPLEPRRQLAALAVNGEFIFDLFVRRQGGLVALTLLLVGLSWRHHRGTTAAPSGLWELLLVALAGFAMYALVHITWRYVAAYVVLLWAGALTRVRLPDSPANRRLLALAGALLTLFVMLDFGAESWRNARPLLGLPAQIEVDSASLRTSRSPTGELVVARPAATPARPRQSRVARRLLEAGLRRGDRVGFVGYSFDAYWARLARLKIVAEIVPGEAELLWQASPARHAEILRAFARAGATAVVAESYPPGTALAGWRPLGDTGYAIHQLAAPERGGPDLAQVPRE